ncbi:MAG: LysM peptidoglycan-binding domain-containing protein [Rhabdochlamydiaceae bacterium]
MTKKRTIIIAVTVNLFLILILFTTGINKEEERQDIILDIDKSYALQKETVADANSFEKTNESSSFNIDSKTQIESLPSNDSVQSVAAFVQELQSADKDHHVLVNDQSSEKKELETPIQTHQNDKPRETFLEVVVKKGDFLEKIAKAHQTTVSQIMKVNKLSSSKLSIGQILKIPASKGVITNNAPSLPSNARYESKVYIVKSGDNPWTIAVKNRIKVEDLLRINNLNEEKARRLKPGDKLKIQ